MAGRSPQRSAHLVVVLLHEAAQCQSEALVRPHTPVHGVHGPWRLVLVNFFPLAVERHPCLAGPPEDGLLAGWLAVVVSQRLTPLPASQAS